MNRIGVVALLLSTIALGVAMLTATRTPAPPTPRSTRRGTDPRVVALEVQVAEMSRELAALRAGGRRSDRNSSIPDSETRTGESEVEDVGSPSDLPEGEKALADVVDAAVERKTKQVMDEMRIKENKKPAMDVFASILELTPAQRVATERVVLEGQRKVYEIFNTPMADGTLLMDDLVDIVAGSIARGQGWQPKPGQNNGWGRLLARIISEKIPGTDETYAARIESVKAAMQTSFKRDWDEAQYKEFQAWGVDPNEIQKVPGSPWEALGERVAARTRELGAEIPEDR